MDRSLALPGSPPRGARGWTLVVVLATALASLGAFAASGGDLVLAAAPLVALLVGWSAVRGPMHAVAYGLLAAALVLDDPRGIPAAGRWKNPLAPLGTLLFDNLNSVTGVEVLRFALVEVAIAALLAVAIARGRARDATPVPRPLVRWSVAATACVLVLWAWGMVRGGDFKSSLWQIRQIFWVGPVTWLFFRTLRGPRDVVPLARIVLAAACVKAAEAFWLYFVICRPKGIRPEHANTHADTVLYVTAVMILVAGAVEVRTRKAWIAAAALLPVFGLAIVFNNRRLAFVSLGASLALAWMLLPRGRVRTIVNRAALAAAPLAAAYLAVGWRSRSVIFAPAAKVASLFSKTDGSAGTRDIENWNLVQTFKAMPLLGHGFGHEYFEIVRAYDVAKFFALYRYIAHNSVLWQWTLGGLVGFTVLWMPLVLAAWFAMRAYRCAEARRVRAAALVCACVVVIQEIQEYGDMGSQSWIGVFVFAAACAMAGKLAVASGAWPAPRRGG